MWASLLRGFIEGILRPLIQQWQQYQHGRTAQQRADIDATLNKEREINDALLADRAARHPLRLDELRFRDSGPAAPDAGSSEQSGR